MPEVLSCFTFFRSFPVDHICIQKFNLNSSLPVRIPGFSALRFNSTHSRSDPIFPDDLIASCDAVVFIRQSLSFLNSQLSSILA